MATPETAFPSYEYGTDVHTISHLDKTILLVGTAHISQDSVALVQQVIEQEKPDCVCLELDDKRFQALTQKKKWQALDLKTIVKNKQLSTLLVSMLMASYQKRLGGQLGVMPGAELLAGAQTAKKHHIPVSLCDRDIRITLRRAWKSTSFFKKGYLLASLLSSVFDKEDITEDKLNQLKKKDVLTEMMDELGEALPDLKRTLIDERDIYLVEKIKSSPGKRIVAVVGAGHIEGMKRRFGEDNLSRLEEIIAIPPVSKGYKIVGWSIPALILGSLVAIGLQKGASVAGANLLFWILANGLPAAAGALLALAHPLTTLSAFASAPITSLTPVIGAGYVTAFVQILVCPPLVKEFESAGDDMVSFKGWWKNRLLRVFLVFLLTGIGSAIGTWIGGYEIMSNLFGK
ncbi:TraB/GumN family protein [Desulforhopalus singaporensis]|uniref:Pheromone shutdown-related protein TraB n=1 Tax=Desulforhopalus singaporensis TaxID=91360 RepID=A0A1H0JA62_9BACT|nr:TraB/GumN family protein [Desulforhopalus singaporensis]SDO40492.1 pheromone shutdown-related protein TraB [Desulforhopalus singaporensis]